MNLGERIYQLRTAQNLSQGDLADLLDVSRQSISKWETNTSIPDLDKLIRLSEIFHVTLDELVLGKEPDSADRFDSASPGKDLPPQGSAVPPQEPAFPPRKIAGTVLLCMSFILFLAALLTSSYVILAVTVPFVACAVICFVCKKHIGLWCAWTVYLLITLLLSLGSSLFLSTWYYFLVFWFAGEPTTGGIVSLLHLLYTASLVIATVLRFRKHPQKDVTRHFLLSTAGFIGLTVLNILVPFLIDRYSHHLPDLLYIGYVFSSTGWVIALTAQLTLFAQYLYQKRSSGEQEDTYD